MSHFFAYLSKMKYIKRWGLMRNTLPENIQEHSLQVAMVAHGLAAIRNSKFGGSADPERAATLAIFHEVSEVITGDLATPIKNFNPEIKEVFGQIENVARDKLFIILPRELAKDYRSLFFPGTEDKENWALVKAADKICAYIKCVEELKLGNMEFSKAKRVIETSLYDLHMPEVDYFMEVFIPSFELTLDELN